MHRTQHKLQNKCIDIHRWGVGMILQNSFFSSRKKQLFFHNTNSHDI